jgi:hypothetical protein
MKIYTCLIKSENFAARTRKNDIFGQRLLQNGCFYSFRPVKNMVDFGEKLVHFDPMEPKPALPTQKSIQYSFFSSTNSKIIFLDVLRDFFGVFKQLGPNIGPQVGFRYQKPEILTKFFFAKK